MWNLRYTIECAIESRSVVSDSLQSHGLYSSWNSPGQNTGVGRVALPFSRGSSQLRSPALPVDSLPAEPQRKPKNTGVGSLSLLQQIFLSEESNRGLLHCRRILLYQLSYQWVLNFLKGFLCIYWNNHMVFIFKFVNVVYHIDLWILNNSCIHGIKPIDQDIWSF